MPVQQQQGGGGVRDVVVHQGEPLVTFYSQFRQPPEVEGTRAPKCPDNVVVLLQQIFGKVCAVLTCDSGDDRHLVHG